MGLLLLREPNGRRRFVLSAARESRNPTVGDRAGGPGGESGRRLAIQITLYEKLFRLRGHRICHWSAFRHTDHLCLGVLITDKKHAMDFVTVVWSEDLAKVNQVLAPLGQKIDIEILPASLERHGRVCAKINVENAFLAYLTGRIIAQQELKRTLSEHRIT